MQSSSDKARKSNHIVVFFGVNTCGNHSELEIFQMAAVYKNYGFNSYIVPKKRISSEVTKMTGFTASSESLYWHKRKLNTTPLDFSLDKFLLFLKIFGKPVILASYGGRQKDSLSISKAMLDYGLWKKFSLIVRGFTEIFPIVKDKLPARKHYKLESVAHDTLNLDISLTLHNVSYDIKTVEKIIQKLKIEDEEIIRQSFPLSIVKGEISALHLIKVDQISLAFLKNIVSIQMIEKLANSGVNYARLRQAYKMNNSKGVKLLLTGCVEGQPKITEDQDIIEKITNMMRLISRTANNNVHKNISFKKRNA